VELVVTPSNGRRLDQCDRTVRTFRPMTPEEQAQFWTQGAFHATPVGDHPERQRWVSPRGDRLICHLDHRCVLILPEGFARRIQWLTPLPKDPTP